MTAALGGSKELCPAVITQKLPAACLSTPRICCWCLGWSDRPPDSPSSATPALLVVRHCLMWLLPVLSHISEFHQSPGEQREHLLISQKSAQSSSLKSSFPHRLVTVRLQLFFFFPIFRLQYTRLESQPVVAMGKAQLFNCFPLKEGPTELRG